MLKENPFQNYISRRAVCNENSLTSPCRIVFDPSNVTCSGCSLTDILVKGCNNMNKLIKIFIRWTSYIAALHTDICLKNIQYSQTETGGLVLVKISVGRKSQSQ